MTKKQSQLFRNDVELFKDFGSVVRKCREGPCGSPIRKRRILFILPWRPI